MPIKRDADGNIIENPTRPGDDSDTDVTKPRAPHSPAAGETGGATDYDAKTVLADTARRKGQQQTDTATRVYRPGRKPVAGQPESGHLAGTAMEDPPAGWLVVTGGPGMGNVVTIGNGVNSIGRNATERLSLDFGDEMISRSGHATITYDPRGRKFYIQHGGGTNLTYVNDDPVLTPRELPPGTEILLGNTTLRFVPLCGEQFDWDTGAVD